MELWLREKIQRKKENMYIGFAKVEGNNKRFDKSLFKKNEKVRKYCITKKN